MVYGPGRLSGWCNSDLLAHEDAHVSGEFCERLVIRSRLRQTGAAPAAPDGAREVVTVGQMPTCVCLPTSSWGGSRQRIEVACEHAAERWSFSGARRLAYPPFWRYQPEVSAARRADGAYPRGTRVVRLG